MITSVSKGVFIVLVFCFIFSLFILIYCFGTGRVGQVLEGRLVGSTKMGTKKKREEKKKKRPQKVWQSAKGWMSMIDFWIFFPSFFLFFYYFYFDIDDIHFVLALRPVTNHAHVFF